MIARAVVILFVVLGTAASASAHPLPNLRFDRTIQVRLAPTAVVIKYTLELSEWTMVLDGNKLLDPGDKFSNSREFATLYTKKKAPFLIDGLAITLDGREVKLIAEKAEIEPDRDHLRLKYTFRGIIAPPAGRKLSFAIEERNFEDKPGKVSLSLDVEPGFLVHDLVEPGGLRGRSPLDLKPGEERLLRAASAIVELPVAATPTPPPDTPTESTPEPVIVGDRPGLARDLSDRGLTALFDTDYGFGILLLAAAAFGMAHAFTPGHGKALVAAYLVGERGTIWHAVVLGLVTTISHTWAVIMTAAILKAIYGDHVPADAEAVLKLAGGILIALVGLWLFQQRFRGRADHVHLFNGHHHHDHDHNHDHVHAPPPTSAKDGFGWVRLILLGIGGGIVPCYDAVILMVFAVGAGKLGFAVPLLLAFSTGLALVLVGLGVGVVLAHRSGSIRFGERRWFRLLPIVSAAILVVMGLWLCRAGMQSLIAADKQQQTQEQR